MTKYTQFPLALPDSVIEIKLTRGYSTIIDVVDFDLSLLKWHSMQADKFHYAQGWWPPINKHILMHRLILSRKLGRELLPNEFCDHINGNPRDNRRDNLRVASMNENNYNSRKRVTNTSGYKGVSWDSRRSKWRAQISFNNKRMHIGYFDTPENAFDAYKSEATKLFGEFARFE